MAWTREAPNGRVKGCWRDHTGKERSRTFATKTAAKKYALKMEAEIDAGIRRDHDLGKMSVGEWLREFLDTSPSMRRKPMETREGWLKTHILPTPLARVPLSRLTPLDIDHWVAGRVKANAGTATIFHVHGSFLNAALNRAVEREIIPRNPGRKASIPEYIPKPKVFIGEAQIVALSEAVNPRYRALILGLGFGGIRVSEAAGLTPKDFEEEEGSLQIYRQLLWHKGIGFAWGEPKSKNRKNAAVLLPDFVTEAVREHIDAGYTSTFDGETLIFSMAPESAASRFDHPSTGLPIRAVTVWKMLKRASREIGLPPAFRTHNLRDSCATNMLAAGASVQDVADQLGDDARTVLRTYVHSSPESRRAALSRSAVHALGDGLRPLRPALPDGEMLEGEIVEG